MKRPEAQITTDLKDIIVCSLYSASGHNDKHCTNYSLTSGFVGIFNFKKIGGRRMKLISLLHTREPKADW